MHTNINQLWQYYINVDTTCACTTYPRYWRIRLKLTGPTETSVACSMAAEGVTVLKRCYIGLAVFTVALIASTGLYVDESWKYKFHLTSFLSVQQEETARPLPRKANQSRASRFVSVCSSDILDRRRLGNQLFNWAAVLYVALLTGLHVCSTMHFSLLIINMLDKRQKPIKVLFTLSLGTVERNFLMTANLTSDWLLHAPRH